MKALKWAFLFSDSVPSELDQGDPIVTALTPPTTNTHDRTCEIPGK
jgi:hypothetical protein